MSVKIWKQIVQLQSNYVGELNRDNIVYLRLFRVLAQWNKNMGDTGEWMWNFKWERELTLIQVDYSVTFKQVDLTIAHDSNFEDS
jgi:hypothetical protein